MDWSQADETDYDIIDAVINIKPDIQNEVLDEAAPASYLPYDRRTSRQAQGHVFSTTMWTLPFVDDRMQAQMFPDLVFKMRASMALFHVIDKSKAPTNLHPNKLDGVVPLGCLREGWPVDLSVEQEETDGMYDDMMDSRAYCSLAGHGRRCVPPRVQPRALGVCLAACTLPRAPSLAPPATRHGRQ